MFKGSYKLKAIKSVEKMNIVGNVYDLEIDDPCHAFTVKSENGAIAISHNSACVSFSNLSDQRMKHAKDGQFWLENPQRTMANNSIAYTEKPDSALFMEEWLNLMRSGTGERGIFNAQTAREKADRWGRKKGDVRSNPCVEALLMDRQLCNLTEVVVRTEDDIQGIKDKIGAAVLLGCLQAMETNFKNVHEDWIKNAEEERLIGVGLTGICDSPLFHKMNEKTVKLIKELHKHAHEVAEHVSSELGIVKPKQVCLIKPSGCTTLETEIITTDGIMSMASIFEANGYNPKDYESGTWLLPRTALYVQDENDEQKQITKLFVNGIKEVFEVMFEDGKSYKFTEEHRLKTSTGWKRMDELEEGDEIISW